MRSDCPTKEADLRSLVRTVYTVITGSVPSSDYEKHWKECIFEGSFWEILMKLANNLEYDELEKKIASL